MKHPMRQKYVDEAVGLWMIWGMYPATGEVDINDGKRDVFQRIPLTVAQKVVEAHDRFRQELYSLLCKEETKK